MDSKSQFRRIEHRLDMRNLLHPKKVSSPTRITSAQTPLSEDIGSRQVRYLISMGIRTACFIATILLPSPYRWITLVGAFLLPYISVVVANAGREPNVDYQEPFNPNELKG
jgi:DMSO reductase anchor subunit